MLYDPRSTIQEQPMTPFQIRIVIYCIFIAALDGFDVLVMAYTAPAISQAWQLDNALLGMLFSAGLFGMGIGALFVAPLGDRIGRRPTVLLCLLLMSGAMLLSSLCRGPYELLVMRILTGIGIGAILANINIVVTEYSNKNRRSLSNALISLGYPAGATLGGLISVYLISEFSWRAPFLFGSLIGLLLVPVLLKDFPESIDYLIARRPKKALERINKALFKLGQPQLASLPEQAQKDKQGALRISALWHPDYRKLFMLSCMLYACVMMSVYFLLSWTPKILTDLGLSVSGGISASMLLNLGGVIGCLCYGILSSKFGTRRLAIVAAFGLFLSMQIFGVGTNYYAAFVIAALIVGFFTYSSIAVLYAVVPTAFPAAIRSTGTGLAMCAGRIGAVLGPYLAGIMMTAGWPRAIYILVLALPMLLACFCLLGMKPSSVSSSGSKSAKQAEVARPL